MRGKRQSPIERLHQRSQEIADMLPEVPMSLLSERHIALMLISALYEIGAEIATVIEVAAHKEDE